MKRLFLVLIFLAALFGLSLLVLPPLLLQSKPVEKFLIHRIEHLTGSSVHYSGFRVSYFPFLKVVLDDMTVSPLDDSGIGITAGRVDIRLPRLAVLIGRPEIAGLSVENADIRLPSVPGMFQPFVELTGVHLKLGAVTTRRPVTLEATALLKDSPGRLLLSGDISLSSLEVWEWEKLGMNINLSAEELPLAAFREGFSRYFRLESAGGEYSGNWVFTKKTDDDRLVNEASVALKDLTYDAPGQEQGMTAPALNMDLDYHLSWCPGREELTIQHGTLKLPVGNLDIAGTLLLGTREIQDLRITASKIVLESIPQYFVHLKEMIPFNIGFSGQSTLEMSLSGTWDHLSIDANWDFTNALLTYARYFSKPKEFPLNVTLDFLLQDSRMLGGDFSVRLKDITMKGSITDLDLTTGEGQVNVITNKFQIDGWQKLIPPIQEYDINGEMKWLANAKGNLKHPASTQTMFNVTLDHAYIAGPEGQSIRDAKVSLDISPLSLELRNTHFLIGEALVKTDLVIYNLNQDPILEWNVASDNIQALRIYQTFHDLAGAWLSKETLNSVEGAGAWIEDLFPEGEYVEDFLAKLKYEKQVWTLDKLEFEAYNGIVAADGLWQPGTAGTTYDMNVNLQKISLARFGQRGLDNTSRIDGNLFLKGTLNGSLPAAKTSDENGGAGRTDDKTRETSWLDFLQGQGTLLITNGEFQAFDILSVLGSIPDLSQLRERATTTTLFNDIRTEFTISGRRFRTSELVMLTHDLMVEAQGDLSFDGFLNYRMDVYLMPELVMSPEEMSRRGAAGSFMGPVPLLLTGPFDNPSLKPDASVVPDILSHLKKKTRQVALGNFLSEDLFFELLDETS